MSYDIGEGTKKWTDGGVGSNMPGGKVFDQLEKNVNDAKKDLAKAKTSEEAEIATEKLRKIKFDHDDQSWNPESISDIDTYSTLGFWSTGAPPIVTPDQTAFLAGAAYAQFPPNMAGAADVITDFNAQLESLKTGDPQALLKTAQSNLEAIVK